MLNYNDKYCCVITVIISSHIVCFSAFQTNFYNDFNRQHRALIRNWRKRTICNCEVQKKKQSKYSKLIKVSYAKLSDSRKCNKKSFKWGVCFFRKQQLRTNKRKKSVVSSLLIHGSCSHEHSTTKCMASKRQKKKQEELKQSQCYVRCALYNNIRP